MKRHKKILTSVLMLLVVYSAFYPVAHCAAKEPTENGHRFDPDCVAAQDITWTDKDCCELHQADDEGHDWHHYHFLFESASYANQLRIDDQAPGAHSVYAVVDIPSCPNADLKLRRAAVPSPLPGYFRQRAVPTGHSPPC
jgi:hypothetical protein